MFSEHHVEAFAADACEEQLAFCGREVGEAVLDMVLVVSPALEVFGLNGEGYLFAAVHAGECGLDGILELVFHDGAGLIVEFLDGFAEEFVVVVVAHLAEVRVDLEEYLPVGIYPGAALTFMVFHVEALGEPAALGYDAEDVFLHGGLFCWIPVGFLAAPFASPCLPVRVDAMQGRPGGDGGVQVGEGEEYVRRDFFPEGGHDVDYLDLQKSTLKSSLAW